jgi:hypothetical protein
MTSRTQRQQRRPMEKNAGPRITSRTQQQSGGLRRRTPASDDSEPSSSGYRRALPSHDLGTQHSSAGPSHDLGTYNQRRGPGRQSGGLHDLPNSTPAAAPAMEKNAGPRMTSEPSSSGGYGEERSPSDDLGTQHSSAGPSHDLGTYNQRRGPGRQSAGPA